MRDASVVTSVVIGEGIDSITRARKNQAVQVTPDRMPAQKIPVPICDLTSSIYYSSFDMLRSFEGSLTIKVTNPDISVEASYKNSTKKRAYDMYYVLRKTEKVEENRLLPPFAFIKPDVFNEDIMKDPKGYEKFRTMYGDTFVSSITYGREIIAIIHFSLDSSDQQVEVGGALSAPIQGTLEIKGDFKAALQKIFNTVSYDIQVHASGMDIPSVTTLKTADELIAYLDQLGESADGKGSDLAPLSYTTNSYGVVPLLMEVKKPQTNWFLSTLKSLIFGSGKASEEVKYSTASIELQDSFAKFLYLLTICKELYDATSKLDEAVRAALYCFDFSVCSTATAEEQKHSKYYEDQKWHLERLRFMLSDLQKRKSWVLEHPFDEKGQQSCKLFINRTIVSLSETYKFIEEGVATRTLIRWVSARKIRRVNRKQDRTDTFTLSVPSGTQRLKFEFVSTENVHEEERRKSRFFGSAPVGDVGFIFSPVQRGVSGAATYMSYETYLASRGRAHSQPPETLETRSKLSGQPPKDKEEAADPNEGEVNTNSALLDVADAPLLIEQPQTPTPTLQHVRRNRSGVTDAFSHGQTGLPLSPADSTPACRTTSREGRSSAPGFFSGKKSSRKNIAYDAAAVDLRVLTYDGTYFFKETVCENILSGTEVDVSGEKKSERSGLVPLLQKIRNGTRKLFFGDQGAVANQITQSAQLYFRPCSGKALTDKNEFQYGIAVYAIQFFNQPSKNLIPNSLALPTYRPKDVTELNYQEADLGVFVYALRVLAFNRTDKSDFEKKYIVCRKVMASNENGYFTVLSPINRISDISACEDLFVEISEFIRQEEINDCSFTIGFPFRIGSNNDHWAACAVVIKKKEDSVKTSVHRSPHCTVDVTLYGLNAQQKVDCKEIEAQISERFINELQATIGIRSISVRDLNSMGPKSNISRDQAIENDEELPEEHSNRNISTDVSVQTSRPASILTTIYNLQSIVRGDRVKDCDESDLDRIKEELFLLVERAVSSREKVLSGDSDIALYNFLDKYGKVSDEFKLNTKIHN